jgi:hypothetical protein
VKKKVLFLLIIISFNTYSQLKLNDRFDFKESSLKFSIYSYGNPTISDFFVVINSNLGRTISLIESLNKCSKERYDFYFLNIGKEKYSDNDMQQLLIQFIEYITSRRKLVDSNMHLILEYDYSSQYEKERYVRKLNEITKLKILNQENSICNLTD